MFARALEIRITPRSNLIGKLNSVDLNRLQGLFTTFVQQIGKVLRRILLSFHGIRSTDLMSSVDDVLEAWKTLFFQAVERNIQKKLIKRRRDVHWLNSDLKKAKTLEEGEILWGSSKMGQLYKI